MAGVIDVASVHVRQPAFDFLRQLERKTAAPFAVPEANRNVNALQSEAPRLAINPGVGHDAFGSVGPGEPLALEADIECRGISQRFGVARADDPKALSHTHRA